MRFFIFGLLEFAELNRFLHQLTAIHYASSSMLNRTSTDPFHHLRVNQMFQYMNAHCQEFGFILRFPDGMEPITGVMYEPFHFRYVGVEAAKYITENNICFETFVSLYRDIGTAENPQES